VRVGVPLMVRLEPSAQVTVRFTIVSPLSAVVLQVYGPDGKACPEGRSIKMRLYEYRDDIVIEYISAELVSAVSGHEIAPVSGPELWIDLINEHAEPRCAVATFMLEKG
jgi:hypothetical protein